MPSTAHPTTQATGQASSSAGKSATASSGRTTAAPSTGPRLITSAAWVTRSGARALKVVPTTAGRAVGVDPEAVWQAVLRLRPDADSPGIHDQLVCHVVFAASKSAWYLEPARPDVGYAATVAAGCNPGTIKDAG
ncbi:MAG: DUF2599 domain-containing protein [Actinomycetales bacterium]|nr:DUF2599 domain-containing protein [Actinomycetales bacterium]